MKLWYLRTQVGAFIGVRPEGVTAITPIVRIRLSNAFLVDYMPVPVQGLGRGVEMMMGMLLNKAPGDAITLQLEGTPYALVELDTVANANDDLVKAYLERMTGMNKFRN